MPTTRVAVTIKYEYSGIPKGCRKPRSMQGSRLAVVDLVEVPASRFPVVYSVIHQDSESRGEGEAGPPHASDLRWGEGRLWCPYATQSGDEIATLVSQCLFSALHDRYGWYRLSEAAIHEAIDKGIAELQTKFRVIGGLLYQTAVEHVWVVRDPCRYRQSIQIELSDEPKGERVFRLDELEAAKSVAAACAAGGRVSTPLEVTVVGEARVERPDLLQRHSGRFHAAMVRSWKVIESVRETHQLLDRLDLWLADPVTDALPPGLTVEDGKRLRDALVQMRQSLSSISDEQTATNISAA